MHIFIYFHIFACCLKLSVGICRGRLVSAPQFAMEDPRKHLVALVPEDQVTVDLKLDLDQSTEQQPSVLGLPIKYASLAFLVAQNSAIAMLMRYSLAEPSESNYLSSTTVQSL